MTATARTRKFNRSNLRRFIRGRAYTSIAQIRRYFEIESDEVSAVQGPDGTVFIALPQHAANTLAQLWQEGRVGVHLSPEVRAAIVDGVYSTEAPVRLDQFSG